MKPLKTFTGKLDDFLNHCQNLDAWEYLEFFNRMKQREEDIIVTLVHAGIPHNYAKTHARATQRLIDAELLAVKYDSNQIEYYDLTDSGKKLALTFEELVEAEVNNYKRVIEAEISDAAFETVNPS